MPQIRYAPGSRRLVAAPAGAVLLDDGAAPELLRELAETLASGAGLPGLLGALTRASGPSLDAIPPFVIVLADGDGARVVVRGALTADVDAASGPLTISGEGVTTWTERLVPDVRSLRIAGSDAVAELPLRDGVVLADGVELSWTGFAEPEAAPQPEPEAAPVAAATVPAEAPDPLPDAPDAEPEPDVPPAPAADEDADLEPDAEPEPDAAAPVARGPWSALRSDDAPSLIDSETVASMTSADTLLPPDATFAAPADPAPEPDPSVTTGYDHLWGETVARVVEDAAVRREEEDGEEDAGAVPPPPAPPLAGDHDGETISVAQARAMRAARSGAAAEPEESIPPLAPPRPAPAFRVRVSTGQVLTLDRTVVIGRRPRSTRVSGTDLPHLVAVDSPQQDISRSHLEIRAEGDSVVATDLHTTNGTMLHRDGVAPVRLHPGEPTVLVTGDLLDLGDGVTAVIEDIA